MKSGELQVQNYVSEFYEQSRYQKPYSRLYHEWWNKKMLSLVTVKGRVLDNGCGTGMLGEILSGKAEMVIGLDISEKMLKYARTRMDKAVLGDSQQLPFADNTFNLVIGRSILHHLPDPLKGIEEMARVLQDGGEMIIADTNRSVLSRIQRLIANKGKHFSNDHKNMLRTQLIRMVEKFFTIEKIYYFGYLAYPIGFPDIVDIGKYLPFPIAFTRVLVKIDEIIGRIPFIRTQSWAIMIKAKKKEISASVEVGAANLQTA
jgi:ubiquinone/menaquinone biosynthesis C-methylase UbiE